MKVIPNIIEVDLDHFVYYWIYKKKVGFNLLEELHTLSGRSSFVRCGGEFSLCDNCRLFLYKELQWKKI